MGNTLKQDEDYYLDEQGYMVFTASFLLKRGFCCHSGCRHCPYQSQQFDPSYPIELQLGRQEEE